LIAAAVLILGSAENAVAEEAAAITGPWREVSMGGEYSTKAWSAYSTLTVAPFGTLDQDGLRVRSGGGYGQYRYDGHRTIRGAMVATEFHGIASFSDVMLGYQAQIGAVTIKAFAGAAVATHSLTPFDPKNEVIGFDIGFKAALETWIDLGSSAWTQIDSSWTTAHDTSTTRVRAGWRITPELSFGPEAGRSGSPGYSGASAGGFLRYADGWGELSVSGGVTGDMDHPTRPYATINWLSRY